MKEIKEYGITLIALVVTIIILLILAGVTIGMATNGTGLFDKAKEATQKYKNLQEDEEMQIAKYNNEIEYYSRAGGSNYSETLIWNTKINSDSLTLLDNHTFTEFDQIIIMAGANEVNGTITNLKSLVIPKSHINEMISNNNQIMEIGYQSAYIVFSLSNNNKLEIRNASALSIFKIYGIKY